MSGGSERVELERLAREIDALPSNAWNKMATAAAVKLIAIYDSAYSLDERRAQVTELGRAWTPASKYSLAQDASFRLAEMMGIVEGRADDMRAKLDAIRPKPTDERAAGRGGEKAWWQFWR